MQIGAEEKAKAVQSPLHLSDRAEEMKKELKRKILEAKEKAKAQQGRWLES